MENSHAFNLFGTSKWFKIIHFIIIRLIESETKMWPQIPKMGTKENSQLSTKNLK